MTPLAKELEAFLADFGQRVPADIRAVMRDAWRKRTKSAGENGENRPLAL